MPKIKPNTIRKKIALMFTFCLVLKRRYLNFFKKATQRSRHRSRHSLTKEKPYKPTVTHLPTLMDGNHPNRWEENGYFKMEDTKTA